MRRALLPGLDRPGEGPGCAEHAEVIDGQQRLTTLTIMFSILRELSGDPSWPSELRIWSWSRGGVLAGITAKPRLQLRKRDADFFRTGCKSPAS